MITKRNKHNNGWSGNGADGTEGRRTSKPGHLGSVKAKSSTTKKSLSSASRRTSPDKLKGLGEEA